MAKRTFEEFMKHVDTVVAKNSGMSSSDFADAPWYDLYEDTDGDPDDDDIVETLSEADEIFAAMSELGGVG